MGDPGTGLILRAGGEADGESRTGVPTPARHYTSNPLGLGAAGLDLGSELVKFLGE